MTIEATVVIDFGADVNPNDYIALIELDDESNEDETTFGNGSSPVISAHFSNNVRIDSVVVTDGSIQNLGPSSRESVSSFQFISRTEGEDGKDLDKYKLPVVPTSTVGVSYKGRAGVTTTTPNLLGGMIEYVGDISATPFIAEYTCTYPVTLYQLTPPKMDLSDDKTYEILIVFYVTLEE